MTWPARHNTGGHRGQRVFEDRFKNRAVRIADLPPGQARELAERVNQKEGRGDDSLRTKAECSALFDLL